MGNLHKKLTVDPVTGNVGVNKDSPQTQLDVGGGIKIGNTTDTGEGVLKWNPTTKRPEFHDGTDWQELGGSGLRIDEPLSLSTMPAAALVSLTNMTAAGPAIPGSMAVHTLTQAVPVHETNEATPLTTMILED